MPNSNEAILERLFEDVWNGERPATADELVHERYLIHDRDLAEELRGPELYRALASGTREAFPDATFAIEDVVAAGDEVALRWTMTGTHEGPAFGVEPTGRTVELSAVEIDRFEDGLLVETWSQSDRLGLLEQLGALPDRA
jgi:predicted ester cyclase